MPHPNPVRRCGRMAAVLVLLLAAPASASDATGGMAAADSPQVEAIACASTAATTCSRGDVVEVKGEGLDSTDTVVFMGGRGGADDRRAKPRTRKPHALTVKVPSGARSGPVQLASRSTGRSAPTPPLRVLTTKPRTPTSAPLVQASGSGVFPVVGEHDYGTAINGFGGGRGHKGQDVFAECGTPLVAALGGTVTMSTFQSRAGNYAVVTADDGTSQAYMHMRRPALVKKGDTVSAGQQIGEVGDTGRATGCHLHFELWTAPGWYEGGEPIDPLPTLKAWDGAPTSGDPAAAPA